MCAKQKLTPKFFYDKLIMLNNRPRNTIKYVAICGFQSRPERDPFQLVKRLEIILFSKMIIITES